LQSDAWDRLFHKTLFLDETSTPLEYSRIEVEQFFEPVASFLVDKNKLTSRIMTVVAGPPGSGKSAFAVLLSALLNEMAEGRISVVIGLDGWHFPNAYLDSHMINRDGESVPLRRIKGSPETFNTEAALTCLSQTRAGGQVPFPIYSRVKHDSIEAAGLVENRHKIVIVEGNYWMLNEDPWRRFQPLFDVRIFITGNPEMFINGLVERHVRGGRSPEDARSYVEAVDALNIQRVLKNCVPADITVHKTDSRRIDHIEWSVD